MNDIFDTCVSGFHNASPPFWLHSWRSSTEHLEAHQLVMNRKSLKPIRPSGESHCSHILLVVLVPVTKVLEYIHGFLTDL